MHLLVNQCYLMQSQSLLIQFYKIKFKLIDFSKMKKKIENKQNLCLPRPKRVQIRDYLDQNLISEQDYINAKVEVFQKYRQKQPPLRVLDTICTNRQLQQQKNLILLHCRMNTVDLAENHDQARTKMHPSDHEKHLRTSNKIKSQSLLPTIGEKRVNSIWKAYLERKENNNPKEKPRYKISSSLSPISKRANTEYISIRKKSALSSHSFIKESHKRNPTVLIFENDSNKEK